MNELAFPLKELTAYLEAFKLRFRRQRKIESNITASDALKETFEQKIKPNLDAIEQRRADFNDKFKKRRRLVNIKILPLSVIVALLLVVLGADGSYFSIIVITFFIGTGWAYKPALDYIHFYKRNVLPLIVKMYGNFNYSLNASFTKDEIKKWALTPHFDYLKTEDSISGSVDNIGFEFSEVLLERGGRNGRSTSFQGCVVVLTMPFSFDSHTIVKQDLGKLANWLSKASKSTKKVALENVAFEKVFEVFSTDQVLARYILSPVMMEQLLTLYALFVKNVNASKLECEFIDNKAVFFISYRENLIEPAWITQSAFELNSLPLIEKEIALLMSISKQLNLDLMALRKASRMNA